MSRSGTSLEEDRPSASRPLDDSGDLQKLRAETQARTFCRFDVDVEADPAVLNSEVDDGAALGQIRGFANNQDGTALDTTCELANSSWRLMKLTKRIWQCRRSSFHCSRFTTSGRPSIFLPAIAGVQR